MAPAKKGRKGNMVCRSKTFTAALMMGLLAGGLSWGQNDKDAKNNTVLVPQPAFAKRAVQVALRHRTTSTDGKLFAGYYRDGFDEVISIHDAKTGEQIKRIIGHGDNVTKLEFTPDGKVLASRCENSAREAWALWDVSTGKLMFRLKGDLAVTSGSQDEPTAYLGMVPDLGADVRGVRIDGIPMSPSPAREAGLKKGDVIVQFGDVPIADVDGLVAALRKYTAGQTVAITANRGKEILKFQATLGTHPNRRTTQVRPDLKRLKSDQGLAVAWFKKEWMARVEYSEGRVIGLVFPGFSNITDEVFDVVATFPDLQSLAVVGAQVTGSGWEVLAKLQNLRKLVIISTKTFTDEEMKYLAGLKKLEVLDLSSTKTLTDAGIESIKGLTALRDVDLDFTKVTDRSLELLSGNKGLEKLWLTSTPITDKGMKSLAKFQHLTHVDLQHTSITDDGLQHLLACKELKHLLVNSTKITKEGAKRFNQTLPKCEIVFAPADIGG